MISLNADYFDGKTSRRWPVTIVVSDGAVTVSGAGIAFDTAVSAIKFSPRLAGMPRRIEFADGAVAVTQDNDSVDRAFNLVGRSTLAHRLESHYGFIVLALALTIATCWAGYRYGVPWVAREVATRLPPNIEENIAQEGLKALDKLVFKPTQLSAERRESLTQIFSELHHATQQSDAVRLEFRDGGWIGANAFALPGGIVVMTDQLVALMASDDQIAAVLAHEMGHVRHRHSLRYVLQDSIIALAAMAIYGDASAVAGIAVTLPTALLHAHYSRDFEREADSDAFELLKNTGRSPRELGLALAVLEAGKNKQDAKSSKKNTELDSNNKQLTQKLSYLSSHPATQERIEAAENAARDINHNERMKF